MSRPALPAAFVLVLVLAVAAGIASARSARFEASPAARPAQISGLLRQLNLRARPAPREVNRCHSSACRAATAPLVA